MKTDPAIQTVRDMRHEISAEFDHDTKRLVEHYIELQKQFQGRLLKKSEVKPQTEDWITEEPVIA